MSIRLRRFLLLSISAITLVAFILYIRTSARIRWFESNDPHRTVTFVTESGTGHGIHANHDDDFHYTAYIASEYSNEVTISLKYADSVQIGDNIYHSGDRLGKFPPETDLTFIVFSEPDVPIATGSIAFLFADSVPSLYVDTLAGSMAEIDNDPFHNHTESASYCAVDTDLTVTNGRCEVSGRGNTTWSGVKKPYDINCPEDISLFGMGAQSKWCLLANCFDGSELKNWFALNLAKEMGISVYNECEFVNLYLNGEYAGLYLLTQSIDVSGGNVKITDLGRLNDSINKYPDDAVYTMVRQESSDDKGRLISYYDGQSPDEISGGYLLEAFDLDVQDMAQIATDHLTFNIRSPRFPTEDESRYISEYMNTVEDSIYENKDDTYRQYIDIDSWTYVYLIQEYLANEDTDRFSSFMYKDRNSDLLMSGPVWDFDNGLGADRYRRRPFTAQTLWLKSRVDSLTERSDGTPRGGWLWGLYDLHDDFREETIQRYYDVMIPAINRLLNDDMPKVYEKISASAHMDYVLFPAEVSSNHTYGFESDYKYLQDWLRARKNFLSDYYSNPDDYICTTFDGKELYHVMFKKDSPIEMLPLDIDGNDVWISDISGEELLIGDIVSDNEAFYH